MRNSILFQLFKFLYKDILKKQSIHYENLAIIFIKNFKDSELLHSHLFKKIPLSEREKLEMGYFIGDIEKAQKFLLSRTFNLDRDKDWGNEYPLKNQINLKIGEITIKGCY